MNFVLAVVLFVVIFNGVPPRNRIGVVVPDSPAESAGISREMKF